MNTVMHMAHWCQHKTVYKTIAVWLQETAFIEQVGPVQYVVRKGFVPGMNVEGTFYVNDRLKDLLFDELQMHVKSGNVRQTLIRSL